MLATSDNFGNMLSLAGASLFISFLPLLSKQILLTNLMADLPEMAIATDNIDQEMLEKPTDGISSLFETSYCSTDAIRDFFCVYTNAGIILVGVNYCLMLYLLAAEQAKKLFIKEDNLKIKELVHKTLHPMN